MLNDIEAALFYDSDCRDRYNFNYRTRGSAENLKQTLLYSGVRLVFLAIIVGVMFILSFRYSYLSDMGEYFCSVVNKNSELNLIVDDSVSFNISDDEKSEFIEKAINVHFRYITPFTYTITGEEYGYIDGKKSCLTYLSVTDSYGLTYNLRILTQPELDVLFK